MKHSNHHEKRHAEFNRIRSTYTVAEIINSGYSPKRAAELVDSTHFNWKAENGGKRDCSKTLGFKD